LLGRCSASSGVIGAMGFGGPGGAADPAVRFAPPDDEPAVPAEARVDGAVARRLGGVAVASLVGVGVATLEGLADALEDRELGEPLGDLVFDRAEGSARDGSPSCGSTHVSSVVGLRDISDHNGRTTPVLPVFFAIVSMHGREQAVWIPSSSERSNHTEGLYQ
jgi:hypothetical protein